MGFTSRPQYVRNVLIRGGYRLVPWWCRRAVYRPVLSRRRDRSGPEQAQPPLSVGP
jgi:hypothetical protein